MNCQQTRSQLVAYLNGEISPTEQLQIQAHLAGCKDCQHELEILSALESRLTSHLHERAEWVRPDPRAWETLQARLAQSPTSSPWGQPFARMIGEFKWRSPEKRTVRQLALALLVIFLLALSAPPAWALAARIGDWIGTWFHFNTPGAQSSGSIGDFKAFIPSAPQYLPEGFDSAGIGGTTAPDLDRLELTFSKGEQFITLLQSKGAGTGSLPQGESVKVNGNVGVYVPDFASSNQDLQQKISGIPITIGFDYGATSLLAWYSGEIKFELVSNLPREEIFKVARSLAQMEIRAGDIP